MLRLSTSNVVCAPKSPGKRAGTTTLLFLLKRASKMAINFMKRPRCPCLLLVYLLLTLLSQCGLGLAQILDLKLESSVLKDLKTKESRNVSFRLAYDMTKLERKEMHFKLSAEIRDEKVAKIVDTSLDNFTLTDFSIVGEEGETPDPDGWMELNGTLILRGLFIGKTKLTLGVLSKESPLYQPKIPAPPSVEEEGVMFLVSSAQMDVWVQNGDRTLIAIFVSTLGCLIIMANLLMGCQLNLEVVWSVLKRPVAPTIGFVCQFLLMPLIAYSLARAIMFPAGLYTLGLGLFTTGCVPGGGASNFWTILLDGNADLSITMTAVSTVAAFGMLPLWMFLLGDHFLPDSTGGHIEIPYKNILISLSCLVLPLFIGVLIRRFFPKCAECAKKVLRPFLIFIIVFILSFGVYANLYMFQLMTWRVLVGGLLLPWCGFMFGCFAGLLSRQPPANVAAIAIETGIQNSGIAIMLLKVSFPQPDADLSSVVPVVVSIFTPGPLLLGVAIHKIMKCLKKKEEDEKGTLPTKDPVSNGVENKAVVYKTSPRGSPNIRVRVEEVAPLSRNDPEG